MANNVLVGCWGVIVGLFLCLFLGWMGFALLVDFFNIASVDGFGTALLDDVFHHNLGQFLVVLGTILATYIGVFRGRVGLSRSLPALRVLLWTGAALSAAALAHGSGGHSPIWVLTLVIVGFGIPLVIGGRHAQSGSRLGGDPGR